METWTNILKFATSRDLRSMGRKSCEQSARPAFHRQCSTMNASFGEILQTRQICFSSFFGSFMMASSLSAFFLLGFVYIRHMLRRPKNCQYLPGCIPVLGHMMYYFRIPDACRDQQEEEREKKSKKGKASDEAARQTSCANQGADEDAALPRPLKIVEAIVKKTTSYAAKTGTKSSATFCTYVPVLPYCVITIDANNVRHILKDNFTNYAKGEFFHSRMRDLLGDGIFNADGESWKAQRKIAVRGMTLKFLELFAFESIIHDLDLMRKNFFLNPANGYHTTANPEKVTIEIFSLMNRFTLEAIAKLGFGHPMGCLDLATDCSASSFAFMECFDECQVLIEKRFWNLTPQVWQRLKPSKDEKRLQDRIKVLKATATNIVQQRKLEKQSEALQSPVHKLSSPPSPPSPILSEVSTAIPSSRNSPAIPPAVADMSQPMETLVLAKKQLAAATSDNNESTPRRQSIEGCDFLSVLLDNIPDATDEFCVDFVLNLLIAGRDTTAQALSWCFLEVLKSPPILALLQEEIDHYHKAEMQKRSNPEGSTGFPFDFRTVRNDFPYLTAVIFEALRCHPSVPWDPKEAQADDVLPDGTTIPKGALVLYSPYLMARDRTRWGEDADMFNPMRWLEGHDSSGHPVVGREADFDVTCCRLRLYPSSFEFPTFQGGPRACLGKDLALMEMKMVLIDVFRNFDMHTEDPSILDNMDFKQSLTKPMDRPLRVTVQLRRDQTTQSLYRETSHLGASDCSG